ncbi:aminodeoxychorismate lyase [Microbacterium sp. STN6]|uniref:aminodeoxychorismate lyase n=1 Tax=Microbacterium sp. STN6 TaxID=2995588 RepID=UPI002260BDF6|nr:aminodeoxychorismate lyase [Microbacterium sp. STN6]MCX7521253.1 aminodeoxychorismate lyase [Microbacterium sp. STN6]
MSPVLALVTRPALSRPATGHAASHDDGVELVDPAAAHLLVTDLGVQRGDGIFETIGVSNGSPLSLDEHLARFAHSAALLDLPDPDLEVWRRAILTAIGAHESAQELSAKIVLTRGVPGRGEASGWVWVEPAGDFTAARTDGIRVVTLDRGYRHDAAEPAPWLLLGAKTLSYAVNQAALREAERRGADDVIFVSSDGYVLEGPTSTVIVRHGQSVSTTPTTAGILAGTTQARAFDFFSSRGFACEFALMPLERLRQADAAWLVSSVRQAAPVRALDGAPLAVDTALTADLVAALLTPPQR